MTSQGVLPNKDGCPAVSGRHILVCLFDNILASTGALVDLV